MNASSGRGLVGEPVLCTGPAEGVHTIEERKRLEEYLHTYLVACQCEYMKRKGC